MQPREDVANTMHAQLLATIPLFATLEQSDRDYLLSLLQLRIVPARDILFRAGDGGDEFFIITSGRLLLSVPDPSGRDRNLAVLKSGDFFGELSLLDGGPRTATATAVTDVELLTLSRPQFLSFLKKHPGATIHIINILGVRQREILDKMRGIQNVNEVHDASSDDTTWAHIADAIATASASKGFVLTHFCAVSFWVIFNLIMGSRAVDPFPFMLMGMLASLEAIFLTMFVLISQNRQTQKERTRADVEYQAHVQSHLEVMSLHEKVDRLERLIREADDSDASAVSQAIECDR